MISYDNLVLKRGVTVGSLLTLEFNAAMTLFKFVPSNVLVTALSEDMVPLAGWMFIRAYPVRWTTSDLDAANKAVVVETMELAYARMQVVRVMEGTASVRVTDLQQPRIAVGQSVRRVARMP